MHIPKQLEFVLITTSDGSQTILNERLGSTYHSRHGALTESNHVFIDNGLRRIIQNGKTNVSILEMGLGTGLNALITSKIALESGIRISYHGLELFPVPKEIWAEYALPSALCIDRPIFESIHGAFWNESVYLNDGFQLTKHHTSLLEFESDLKFDLVYFDAFEPETQPELWTQHVFEKLFSMMDTGGILTTYCCKGQVRRNMLAAGFMVEKVPGPPGKREMIVAHRPL
ncbi:MAG: hypothetical protein RL266_2750 [Bacteroidota bacterium]|jgi:tRNA U34 5-methylaminomethyl-2-thiouridine-forming methyltransferase MnmC